MKIRNFTSNLLGLVVSCVAMNLAVPAFAQANVIETYVSKDLEFYLGKDLHKMSDREVASLLKLTAVNKKTDSEKLEEFLVNGRPSPHYIWKLKNDKPGRFAIFAGQRLFMIPGGSSARIFLFDDKGERLKSWYFSTGWRIDLESASHEFSDEMKADLITIKTKAAINGRNIGKQYFALLNDELLFLRLEDEKGQQEQNAYIYDHHTFGVIPKARTEEEWEQLLSSDFPAEVLSGLTFIGGLHHSPPEDPQELNSQMGRIAKLVDELRRHPQFAKRIQQHSESKNPWVKDAAIAAMKTLLPGSSKNE